MEYTCIIVTTKRNVTYYVQAHMYVCSKYILILPAFKTIPAHVYAFAHNLCCIVETIFCLTLSTLKNYIKKCTKKEKKKKK